jgi:hypothetical protein
MRKAVKKERVGGGQTKSETKEALAKVAHFVILNKVKDLKLLKIRDSSLRSE